MSSKIAPRQPVPDREDTVWLEYVFINYRKNIVSKTYIVKYEPTSVEDCPSRSVIDCEIIDRTGPNAEKALCPVAMYKDPFRLGCHKIVLCVLECFSKDSRDGLQKRFKCQDLMEKVADQEPWFGFEQEYFFVNENDVPHDWNLSQIPEFDARNQYFHGQHTGRQRVVAEEHLRACEHAGLVVWGMNRERYPSQWEYQLGPVEGVAAPDQLVVSRYILLRLAEAAGLKVSFACHKCLVGTIARNMLHVNFSTNKMRAESGLQHIHKALENIATYRQEDILKFYDLEKKESETGCKWRQISVPSWDKLICRIGVKYGTSIRIPSQTAAEGQGFFEERRPCGEADPYDVCRVLTAAALLQNYVF